MKLKKIINFAIAVAISGFFAGALLSAPAFAAKKLPEVDSDGLHLQKKSKVAAAYMKPGADLGQYSRVKLLDCYVDFVKDWERNYNLSQVGIDGRVRDKDAEAIKNAWLKNFARYLQKS